MVSLLNDGTPYDIYYTLGQHGEDASHCKTMNELNLKVMIRSHDKTSDFIDCVKNHRNMTSCHIHVWHVHVPSCHTYKSYMTQFRYIHVPVDMFHDPYPIPHGHLCSTIFRLLLPPEHMCPGYGSGSHKPGHRCQGSDVVRLRSACYG